jgi:adenylylsulfate kinase
VSDRGENDRARGQGAVNGQDAVSGEGAVIWLTGRPAAGKSTLAGAVHARLAELGHAACVLDGDVVRDALVPAPGYDEEGRLAFYATLGRLAAYLAGQGLIVLVPATAHQRAFRAHARAIAPRFVEVYVSASGEACAQRDVKGLYARAHAGELAGLPGVDAVYEEPIAPDIVAAGGRDREAAERIVKAVLAAS